MMKKLALMLVALMVAATSFAQITNARRVSEKEQAKIMATQKAVIAPVAATSVVKAEATPTKSNTVINTFPYNEGFENGYSDWTLIDSDGDGVNWFLATTIGLTPHTGSDCMVSNSYDNSTGVLYPDNWMISSQIQLPATATNFELSWYDAAQDASYPAENYAVYIATTNTVAGFVATTPVFTTVLSTDSWIKRTVNLSSYAGQNIYVAFRHFNVSDQYMMKIDDIYVGGPQAAEVSISGPISGYTNEAVTFTATCSDVTATLAWTIQGATPATATGATATATWATAGTYDITVTATNSIGTSTATHTITILDCSAITTLPWTENFVAGIGCWSIVDNNEDGNTWDINNSYGLESDACAYINYASDGNDDYLISQAITIPATGTYYLSWYASIYSSIYPETYHVMISTTGRESVSNFTSIFNETLSSTEYVKRSIDLSSYAGQTINVAFRNVSVDQYKLFIDNVRIGSEETPYITVAGDANGRVGDPIDYTASVTAGATLAWTFTGNPIVTYNTDNTVATATWAAAGTYDITVTATNSIGSSSATTSVEIIDCTATITLPFTATFDETLGCWDTIQDGESGFGWYTSAESGAQIGQVISMSAESILGMFMIDVEVDNWLISNNIEVPATGNYDIMWNVMPYTTSYPNDHYGVYIINGSQQQLLFEETLNSSMSSFEPRVASIPASCAGQTIQIAFRHFNNPGGGYVIVLDQIKIDVQQAPIVSLNGPASVIAGNSATYTAVCANADSFAWTVDGAAVSEASAVLTHTFTAAGIHTVAVTATNVAGSNTATMEVMAIVCNEINQFPYTMGFEPSDAYDCWTFIDADGDGYGWDVDTWSGSEFVNSGEGAVGSASYINNVGALNPDNWMITPAITLPSDGNANISWFVGGVDASYYDETYAVLVSTTGNNIDDFNNTLYYGTVASVEFTEMQASLDNYLGQTIYIAFRHYDSNDVYWMIIDDITINATGHQVEEENANGVVIYPNPTTGMVYVNAANAQEIQVLDVDGRVVMSQNNADQINLSNLSNGVYMVRVITSEGVSMQKIVKE